MKLRLIDRRTRPDWTPPVELLGRLESICAEAGQPTWPLDLVLVDDEIIVSLNEGFREASGVTDVLSFSYLSLDGGAPPALEAGAHCARCDLWRGIVEEEADAAVGEIILAPGFIRERCGQEGWPFEDEVALLVAHGCLHVLGWEHSDKQTIQAMREQEASLLARAGFSHPLYEGGA